MISPTGDPAPLLRKEFRLDGPVASARLYVTAHGLYRASINGQPVSDDAFAPGWTTYRHRLQLPDLRRDRPPCRRRQRPRRAARRRLVPRPPHLRQGQAQRLRGHAGPAGPAGGRPDAAAGRWSSAPTASWRSSTCPVTSADLYEGEHYDARLEQPGWPLGALTIATGGRARWLISTAATLVAPDGPPGPPGRAGAGPRGADLAVRQDAARLRPEPHRYAAHRRPRRERHRGAAAARGGARARRTRRPSAADSVRNRQLHAARRPRGRAMGAPVHLPRFPVRGGERLAGRAAPG